MIYSSVNKLLTISQTCFGFLLGVVAETVETHLVLNVSRGNITLSLGGLASSFRLSRPVLGSFQ